MTGLISGNDRQSLTELIRAIIREERKKEKAVRGNGGNTVIVSDGDILLRTMGTHKAYYNGTEIGAGNVSGTVNKLAKFTSANIVGNSKLSDNNTGLLFNFGTYVGTGAYITNDNNGTLELHVPSGQAIKIVVG